MLETAMDSADPPVTTVPRPLRCPDCRQDCEPGTLHDCVWRGRVRVPMRTELRAPARAERLLELDRSRLSPESTLSAQCDVAVLREAIRVVLAKHYGEAEGRAILERALRETA